MNCPSKAIRFLFTIMLVWSVSGSVNLLMTTGALAQSSAGNDILKELEGMSAEDRRRALGLVHPRINELEQFEAVEPKTPEELSTVCNFMKLQILDNMAHAKLNEQIGDSTDSYLAVRLGTQVNLVALFGLITETCGVDMHEAMIAALGHLRNSFEGDLQ